MRCRRHGRCEPSSDKVILEAMVRGWMNLIDRLDGPMHLRFVFQPATAAFFAIRAGIRDARAGEAPFLAALWHHDHTRDRLRRAWRDVRNVFVVAALLDVVYQVSVHRSIFLLELLLTASLLTLLPYTLLSGPARRVARAWMDHRAAERSRQP